MANQKRKDRSGPKKLGKPGKKRRGDKPEKDEEQDPTLFEFEDSDPDEIKNSKRYDVRLMYTCSTCCCCTGFIIWVLCHVQIL